MDWDKLRIFHAVAEAGSFTHAGEVLNLSQSAVSRQISSLEQDLRVPLFRRHARGLILTEQGELLYRTARDMLAKVALTEAMITEAKDRPKGPPTVTSTVGLAPMWPAPRPVAAAPRRLQRPAAGDVEPRDQGLEVGAQLEAQPEHGFSLTCLSLPAGSRVLSHEVQPSRAMPSRDSRRAGTSAASISNRTKYSVPTPA